MPNESLLTLGVRPTKDNSAQNTQSMNRNNLLSGGKLCIGQVLRASDANGIITAVLVLVATLNHITVFVMIESLTEYFQGSFENV